MVPQTGLGHPGEFTLISQTGQWSAF